MSLTQGSRNKMKVRCCIKTAKCLLINGCAAKLMILRAVFLRKGGKPPSSGSLRGQE